MPSSISSNGVSSVRSLCQNLLSPQNSCNAKRRYIPHTVDNLKHALSVFPDLGKGTLRGARCARDRYERGNEDNYLFSLDARDSTILTLYNPVTKKGVVHHFDDKAGMERDIQKSIDFLGGFRQAEQIEAHIIGGIWFSTGEKVGNRIQETLRSCSIEPEWKDWSFTPFYGHRYGAILELEHGHVTVFEHTADVATAFKRDKLEQMQSTSRTPSDASTTASEISALTHDGSLSSTSGHASGQSSVHSLHSRNSFYASHLDRKILKNSVGDINYALIGPDKQVKRFRNAFNEKIDEIRGDLSKKSFLEIRAFLEGVKQALPDAKNIYLEVEKPLRRGRLSLASTTDDSLASLSTFSRRGSEAVDVVSHFGKTYLGQEALFTAEQKKLLKKVIGQITDVANAGMRSKAHTAEVCLFSEADQKKIADEFGPGTSKLYSMTLAGWDSGERGRGKWRLLYKRQSDGIHFFGVYDTHRNPYAPYV